MNARHAPWNLGLAGLALAATLAGCSDRATPAIETGSASRPSIGDIEAPDDGRGATTERFELAAPGGCLATIDRWVDGEGAERLHGETALRTASGTAARVVEDVRIGRDGRLLWAHVTTRGDDPRGVELDGEHAVARVAQGRSPPLDLVVPDDAPWIYTTLTDNGVATATPIAAYVAARATARGEPVRRVDVARRASHLVVGDQVRVDTETGPLVVLGDDVADLDDTFVARLSLRNVGITLERVAAGDDGDDLACR